MTTPILMLILLTAPYTIANMLNRVIGRTFDVRNGAVLGLGILFIFTGIGHFIQTLPMAQMLPPAVPWRVLLVYATGILEFAIALGLFFPRCRRLAGTVAIIVLVLFFPANIYAAFNHIPMGGHEWGPTYLFIRAPLQAIIILWAYWFTVRKDSRVLEKPHNQAVSLCDSA